MSISKQEIANTARLARIRLRDDEIDSITSRITSILEMVDQMQAIDTSEVEPMSNSLDAAQLLRADKVEEPADKIAAREALMAGAPAQEDGLFLVPKVIE
ncbi:MAG: Asp-tRNA(Asn)/Glu-tRNA(Gln) amidotransferase subunit GatC [Pseudomonadales bacterium]|nr:Asp-tRNA(Asn)/Glu-tRNA(Gln) amidotransferase subunit GatC [Pseudomonadales bacterium]